MSITTQTRCSSTPRAESLVKAAGSGRIAACARPSGPQSEEIIGPPLMRGLTTLGVPDGAHAPKRPRLPRHSGRILAHADAHRLGSARSDWRSTLRLKKTEDVMLDALTDPHAKHHPGAGRHKTRKAPRGRQVEPQALDEVRELLADRPRRRDL